MKRKSSLQRRFLALYLVLVVTPILALSFMVVHSSYQAFVDTVKSSAKTSSQQTRQLLEYYVNNINEMINAPLASDEFHKILEKNNDVATMQEQVQDMLFLRRMLGAYSARSEVDEVLLFLDNRALYIGENAQTRHLEDALKTNWYAYVESSYPESALIPGGFMDNPAQIGYAKAIRSTRNYNRTTGVILFMLNRALITDYLGGAQDAQVFIVNARGERIAEKKNGALILPDDFQPAEADGESFDAGGSRWYLYAGRLENTDWFLVYLEPCVTMNRMLEARGWGYLLVLVSILGLGILFYRLFLRMYLKRIERVREHMSASQLPAQMTPGRWGDEIDDLIRSYNEMILRIEQLMKEQYRLGNQIREAELRSLYEQINPHFLYNTLAMINWLAEDGKIREVSQVITALSSFYRLSLNKGNENISLKDELLIARNFIYIQQMRFGTDIRLSVDLDSAYESFILPKLTLQPLVENALIHGILKRRDKCGEIRVEVAEKGENLVITVANNGLTIPEDVIRKLNSGAFREDGSHYGIRNVVQRASLYYARPCAIAYESGPDGWTRAILTLPYDAAR